MKVDFTDIIGYFCFYAALCFHDDSRIDVVLRECGFVLFGNVSQHFKRLGSNYLR